LLVPYILFHCCVYFLHPNLIYLIARSISYHHVSQDLSTAENEPVVEDISFETADDTIVEDVIIAEEAPTELVREEVEATPPAALRREVAAQPTPLRRERLRSISLPTILEEEEEEQVEAQPSPAVRRRRCKREVASLLTDLGGYWKSPPSPCGRRRSSRDRRKPQRYVP